MRKHKKEEVALLQQPSIILELISYNADHYDKFDQLPVEDLIPKLSPDRVSWINLDGLTDLAIIEKLQAHFCFHSLLIEDVLNDQRPKAEEYDDYLYFTLKMLYRIEGSVIDYEQVRETFKITCTNYG